MPDLDRMLAVAERAQLRSEMARSQSLLAKASLHARALRWSSTKARLLAASRMAGASTAALDEASQAGALAALERPVRTRH
jgi:hypothetical protein